MGGGAIYLAIMWPLYRPFPLRVTLFCHGVFPIIKLSEDFFRSLSKLSCCVPGCIIIPLVRNKISSLAIFTYFLFYDVFNLVHFSFLYCEVLCNRTSVSTCMGYAYTLTPPYNHKQSSCAYTVYNTLLSAHYFLHIHMKSGWNTFL